MSVSQLPSPPPPYPIDYVITWVDGADPIHQEERKKALGSTTTTTASATSNRWTDHSELYYAVASIRKFAKFIRNIYVVVSLSQRPRVPENSNVVFVDDLLLFPAPYNQRPTFNSHAIEACLCFIPDLAEHFLYGCDDMFLVGGEFHWFDFFDVGKGNSLTPRFLPGNTFPATSTKLDPSLPGWYAARLQNHKLLQSLFPKKKELFARDAKHQVRAVLKSVMLWMWHHPRIEPLLRQTVATQFRHYTNLEPIGLAVQVARVVVVGGGSISTKPRTRHRPFACVYLTMYDSSDMVREVTKKVAAATPTLLCINDETHSGRPNKSLAEACETVLKLTSG